MISEAVYAKVVVEGKKGGLKTFGVILRGS